MFDTLIANATIVDGTGNVGYRGTLGVKEGVLTILRGTAELPEHGELIDASGLVAAPGFIDMHSHTGLMLLDHPENYPKVMQGVTTEVVGVDGISYAPFRRRDDLSDLVRFNAGLDGFPVADLDWLDVTTYLNRLDGKVGVNVALLIGNCAPRISAIGWDQVPATAAQLTDMASMLREAFEQGAFGLSTGLDYAPGSYASTEELAALAAVAAEHGGFYHTHVRYSLGDRFLDPFREAMRIGRDGDCPVHITHFYWKAGSPGGATELLSVLDEGEASGCEVTFDSYPYEWSSTRLSYFLPQWMQEGGSERTLRTIATASARDQFKAELDEAGVAQSWRAHMDYVRVTAFTVPDNLRYDGRTLGEIARHRGGDVLDVLLDLLIEEDLRLNKVQPGPAGTSIATFIRDPRSMVGTDSVVFGEKPSPRTYGSFPRILGEFVRDLGVVTLPEAVRRFTSFPAQRLGLRDRGMLRDGMAADIVLFDPARVKAQATYDQPRQQPIGIEYVFLNGQMTVRKGECLGTLAGRALRHQ
jgi:N-acyl-D-amino-acid deacylase